MDGSLSYENISVNKADNVSHKENECILNIENKKYEEADECQKETSIASMQGISESFGMSNFIEQASKGGLKNCFGGDGKQGLGDFEVMERRHSEYSNKQPKFNKRIHEQEMKADMMYAASKDSIRGNICTHLNKTITKTGVPRSRLEQEMQNNQLLRSNEIPRKLFCTESQYNYNEIASKSGAFFSPNKILKSSEDFIKPITGEMRLIKEVILSVEEDSSTNDDDSSIENENKFKKTFTEDFNRESSLKFPLQKNEDYAIVIGISAEEKKANLINAAVSIHSTNGNNGRAGLGTTSVATASSVNISLPNCSKDLSYEEMKQHNSETKDPFIQPKMSSRITQESEMFTDKLFSYVKFVRTSPGEKCILSIKYNEAENICEICKEKFISFSHVRNHLHPYKGKKRYNDSAQFKKTQSIDECLKGRVKSGKLFTRPNSNSSSSSRYRNKTPSKECTKDQNKLKKADELSCLEMANYFHCAHCGKAYTIKQSLQYHIWSQHNPERLDTFRCDHCRKDFSNENSLRCHIRIYHHNSDSAKIQF